MNERSSRHVQPTNEPRERVRADELPDMVGTLTRLIAGLMALAMALLMTQLR
jgi:hypothetical protein